MQHGDARRQAGDLGRVERCLDPLLAIIAEGRFQMAVESAGRALGVEAQGAAGRVAAEQRALWPAQHFELFQVGQIERGADGPADINVVDIKADR